MDLPALEQQAEQLEQQLRSVRQERMLFLATMSHELRTPLNAILGFSGLLVQDSRLPTDLCQDLQAVHVSARALNKIVSDIIDLAKLDAGCMVLKSQAILLADFLDAFLKTALPQWQKSAVAWVCDGISAHCQLHCDAQRLGQVLSELLDNAFTFTDAGQVRLWVTADVEQVWINITDTGIGIDKKHLLRVFQRFQQVDAGTTRRHGAGLGLALCKDLVTHMGGQLWMESYPHQGTTVHVSLPAVSS